MKTITLSKELFNSASNKNLPIVPKKPIVPITGCYRLSFDGKDLSITSTDFNSSMLTKVPAEGKESFDVCIPAYQAHRIMSSLLDMEVILQVSDKNVKICSGVKKGKRYAIEHTLPITDSADFPRFEAVKNKASFMMHGSVFKNAMSSCTMLCPSEDSRPALNGVCVTSTGDEMNFMSSDGHVGCVSAVVLKTAFSPIIIPKNICAALTEVLDGIAEVYVTTDGQRAFIQSGTTSIICRCIDEKYPDMLGLLKSIKRTHTINFSSGEIKAAITRLMYHKNDNAFTMVTDIREDEMSVVLDNVDYATQGDENIHISGNPSPMKISFNIDLFFDCITACNGTHIDMMYSAPNKGAILTPSEPEDNRVTTTIVIMPSMIVN